MGSSDDTPAFIPPDVDSVVCFGCSDYFDASQATGIDLSDPDEYYPDMGPLCPSCAAEFDSNSGEGE